MDKILELFGLIDWLFAAVLLVGGRYWGSKFFTISKNPALNFLAFASVFGILWLVMIHFVTGIKRESIVSLFLTYLFATSFYELLAKFIFEQLEKWVKKIGGGND